MKLMMQRYRFRVRDLEVGLGHESPNCEDSIRCCFPSVGYPGLLGCVVEFTDGRGRKRERGGRGNDEETTRKNLGGTA